MNNQRELNYEEKFKEVTGQNFTKFYNKYFPKLVWKIKALNINKLDAEDLANKAFIQSIDKIHQFDPETKNSNYTPKSIESNFGTWLFIIGINLGRKFKKDNAKTLVVDINDNSSTEDYANNAMQYYINAKIDELDIDLESQNISMMKYNETLKEIDKLGPKYKNIVKLCDIDGHSYNEICDILGINLQTVKNRLFHGRSKIQKNIQQKFEFITEHY